MTELKVYAVCLPRIPLGGLFVSPTNNKAKFLGYETWKRQHNLRHDDYLNVRAQIIEWEPGWDDGEFWHSLPEGEVVDSKHAYIESLWRGWPQEWPKVRRSTEATAIVQTP